MAQQKNFLSRYSFYGGEEEDGDETFQLSLEKIRREKNGRYKSNDDNDRKKNKKQGRIRERENEL